MKKKNVINTDGGAYIGGNVNTGGGNLAGRDYIDKSGLTSDGIKDLFDSLLLKIDGQLNLSNDEIRDLKAEVEELRNELAKKDLADESFIMRHLRNIGRMAPDILEVTLATITNPAAGFGVIAKKVAEKIKGNSKQ